MTVLVDNPELLRNFKAGTPEAIAAVYLHFLPLVAEIVSKGFHFESEGRHLRFRGTRSPFEADDLIADIFVRAFRPRARDAYDGLRPYANYLKTIARNTIIDRSRQRDPLGGACLQIDDELADNHLPSDDATPFDHLVQSEVLTLADAFIRELAERERSIIRQRFVDGRTQAEVAAALQLSVPTVRKLERKIVRLFFRYMRGRGYFEKHRSADKLGVTLAGILVLALVIRHGMQ
ncbi:MAG: sigma-70 family RNA polymerase sigma factor [Deltaproteobacteria bacterium]|nr:sigma-70 family RNA polymerase sigma factor [Deltaproteobacteria bacterium]